MNLMYTKREKEIIDQINKRFSDTYQLDFGIGMISIFIIKNTGFKLNIDLRLVTIENALILSVYNNKEYCMRLDEGTDYLDVLSDIIVNLNNQFNMYKEFIFDFQTSLQENGYETVLDLVEAKLYIRNHQNKVVIEPVFEMCNDENYATFIVNNICGKYPMKRYTSISFDDLKDNVDFFL